MLRWHTDRRGPPGESANARWRELTERGFEAPEWNQIEFIGSTVRPTSDQVVPPDTTGFSEVWRGARHGLAQISQQDLPQCKDDKSEQMRAVLDLQARA